MKIGNVVRHGKANESVIAAFGHADASLDARLIGALSHRNPLVRGITAMLLGRRGLQGAVRGLLHRLKDQNVFVRQDASWAIERILGFAPGEISAALGANAQNPKRLHQKFRRFLRRSERQRT